MDRRPLAGALAERESVAVADTQAHARDRGQSRFEIYRTERVSLTSTLFGGGDWHWRLTGSSGAVVADCGGYRNEAQCAAAVEALRADASAAAIINNGRDGI